MADKTPDQLTSATTAADTDLLMVYPAGGPLKKYTFASFLTQVTAGLGSAFLIVSNNLSDLASATAARANLGLGTAATLGASALFQTANNLSEVANAATARTNLGAAAAASPTITGGMTFSGSHKGNTQALAGTEIDVSLAEGFSKSISANTAFTITGAVASKLMAFVLELTIASAAVPSWPASVEHSGGDDPSALLGNGKHVLGFLTLNGGTTWTMVVLGVAVAV